MYNVDVSISGIVQNCDQGILALNVGNGYSFHVMSFEDLPFRQKIVDGSNNVDAQYYNSIIHTENQQLLICLTKTDSFQIPGFEIEIPDDAKLVMINPDDYLCSDQLAPYQESEKQYLQRFFNMLRLFQSGNIGMYHTFFNYTYGAGLLRNTLNHTVRNESRNIADRRKYLVSPEKISEIEKFISDYQGNEYAMLLPCINEFIWGLEQIDMATGFEQCTTALEMILLEKNENGKKQVLANRVSMLISDTSSQATALQSKMHGYYRLRSESLHEGDTSNISQADFYDLQDIVRCVIKKTLERCKLEIGSDPSVVWDTIKSKQINDLKAKVTIAKSSGILL